MSHNSATIEVRRSRGTLVVNGLGVTPRGQKFIADQVKLSAHDFGDKNFKTELATAVKQIIDREA